MALRLYNTLTREKQDFTPLDPANVRMYVCGPTVYDFAHIGNARPVIVFDVLYRLLRHVYGEKHVTYVRNITDVDDKINARAARDFPELPLNEAIARVTEATTAQFHKDIAALGVLPPDVEPRATGHIDEMKAMIEVLVAKGHAYVAEGHVLFNVPSMKDYGRLSGRSLEEMEAGARVEVAPYKRDRMDFVLWKPSKAGEPAWSSPCGIEQPGRPGWHIECSAMSEKHLGPVFDIHGGGIDLVFPHHENEVAQSCCAHGTERMAQVWMHNGFLQVEGEKMSKSLGNFITINELLETNKFGGHKWPPQIVRLAMLMTHYRQPLDFTVAQLEQASTALGYFKTFSFNDEEVGPTKEFFDALEDDLNTPRALAELHRLLKVARSEVQGLPEKLAKPGAILGELDNLASRQLGAGLKFLGLELENFDTHWVERELRQAITEHQKASINAAITARLEARKRKDFKESDRIRDELAAMGIQLKDAKDPATGAITTTWEVKR